MVQAKLRHEKNFHCRNKNDPKSGRKTQRSEEIATNTAETEKIGKREDKELRENYLISKCRPVEKSNRRVRVTEYATCAAASLFVLLIFFRQSFPRSSSNCSYGNFAGIWPSQTRLLLSFSSIRQDGHVCQEGRVNKSLYQSFNL